MIQELDDYLTTAGWSFAGGQQKELQRALINLVDSGVVWEAADRILNDARTVQAVFAKSSVHDNGFLRITLASTAAFGLRLHVWDRRPGRFESKTENIHSHTVDFATVILLGGYRHDIYQDADGGEQFDNYEFRARRDATSYSLVHVGTSTVTRLSTAHLPAGVTYTLDGAALHTVTPMQECLTISLVLKGPQYRPCSRVLTRESIPTGPAVPVPSLPAGALKRYIAEVLATRSPSMAPAYKR